MVRAEANCVSARELPVRRSRANLEIGGTGIALGRHGISLPDEG
jgi:hypothetical protein